MEGMAGGPGESHGGGVLGLFGLAAGCSIGDDNADVVWLLSISSPKWFRMVVCCVGCVCFCSEVCSCGGVCFGPLCTNVISSYMT
jgi:hypothetical protein